MKYLILILMLTACGTSNEKETIKEVEKAKEKQSAEDPQITDESGITTIAKDIQTVVERIEVIENKPEVAYDNVWRDPITDDLWVMGEMGDFDNVAATCAGEWSSPSKNDLLTAVYRGLLQALQLYHSNQTFDEIWSGEESTTNNLYGHHVEINGTNTPNIMADLKTDVKFTVCVNKNEGN